MAGWSRVILHPILFSVYPVLFIFVHNLSEVEPVDLLLPMLVTSGVGAGLWLVGALVLRGAARGALGASLSMLMGLVFGHLYYFVVGATGWSGLQRRHAVIVWLLLYLAGMVAIVRMRRGVVTATRLANTAALVMTLLTALSIGVPHLRAPGGGAHAVAAPAVSAVDAGARCGSGRPDIYYIILDGYGRADTLQRSYGFDNHSFLEGLKKKGFVVATDGTSNYSTTHESITSSLNMDYLEGHGYSAPSSAAAAFLRSLGYRYVLVPSGVPFTNHSPLANVTVELGIWTESQLSALLLEYSAIWFVANTPQRAIEKGIFAGVGGMGQWHEHITRSIEAIEQVAKTKAPTFTFAHIVSPHPPYVFNSDGSLNRHGNMGEIGNFDHYNWWSASDLFVNQVVHLNRLVDGMVTRILARSATPPIIIIHGDHGTYALSGKRWRTDDPPPELIKERMSILLAWHAPEPLRRKLHDSMTPVNIFRIVFNECFGARFPLLPDRNVWSFDSPMHDVTDVVRETR